MEEAFDPSQIGRPEVPPEWNVTTSRIIEAAMEVHTTLGPGLLEGVYEDAMCVELDMRGIRFQRQLSFPMMYKGRALRTQRCDLAVENLVILELKSAEGIEEKHLSTMLGYMRALDLPLGLCINFNVAHLRDGIRRRINARSTRLLAFSSSPTPPRTPALPLRTSAC